MRTTRASLRLVAPLLVLALGACSTLGSEDRTRLTLHLENAAQYYDQRHYERAYQQWAKALELEPLSDKARLGQGMALYQLGLDASETGVQRLAQAEELLDELREQDMDGQEWKAELGYALVQEHWVELHDLKVRMLKARLARSEGGDRATEDELRVASNELMRHIGLAENSFKRVLKSGEQEAQYQLTCMLGLSKMSAFKGDWPEALERAKGYESQVVKSKQLWNDAIKRFPREAPLYEQKLAGAKAKEAELRDLLGNVLFKMGRLEEAERELNVVIELDPDRSSAFLNRGIVRQAREDWDRARHDLRTFLAMTKRDENDPSVLEASERLIAVEAKLRDEDEILRLRDGG